MSLFANFGGYMSKIKSYKDLKVWNRSMNLVEHVYRLCEELPKAERFGLTSQIQRSAVTVPTNIAEGFGRRHRKEYRQFLYISYASLSELETLLMLAVRVEYLIQSSVDSLLGEIDEIQRMLRTLISKLEK